MEELIILLIRLFAGLFDPKPNPLSKPRVARPAARSNAPSVPMKRPGVRRATGRRPMPPPIAVAQAIVTRSGPLAPAALASTGTARAKSIAESAAPAAKPAATAASLRKWMTPETLRQQFMLTEILQPPLALRQH